MFTAYKCESGIYTYSTALNRQHAIEPRWTTLTALELTQHADQTGSSPLLGQRAVAKPPTFILYMF
ncbi:MipA/OmpV family protein [Pantoea sp. Tr-811]|nr:MipA/OmpV family protein [Pantoea sp. Tr-811]